MKRVSLILAMALMGFIFSGAVTSVEARGKVYVRVAPPGHRVVVVKPASPHRHGVWANGYWAWRGGRHIWVDGRWMKPRHGRFWVDGRWINTRHGWEWMPGHWQKR